MLSPDSKHFSAGPPKLGGLGHKHPRITRYRIHGDPEPAYYYYKETQFDDWGPEGAELPDFDDVISLIDAAEDELDREIKQKVGDHAMPKRTLWKYGYVFPVRCLVSQLSGLPFLLFLSWHKI